MAIQKLTEDAKAILLLCGRFQGRAVEEMTKPLTLREYNPLADWMGAGNLRPADLLKDFGANHLKKAPPMINSDRVRQLLSRGGGMALAIEKWTNNGVWVICRSDLHYPERLKRHLKKQAPPILYGVGDINLLKNGGLAILGSRNVDKKGEVFTRKVAVESAHQGIQIVSGGARGVDQVAMIGALESGGNVLGVMADSLLKSAVSKNYRDRIRHRQLTLISPYSPDSRFNVGNAMGRNKLVYAMADYALIISAEVKKGGTWAGATEELKREAPRAVFVCDEENAPKGNQALIALGALPFPKPPWEKELKSLIHKIPIPKKVKIPTQLSIFGDDTDLPPVESTVK